MTIQYTLTNIQTTHHASQGNYPQQLTNAYRYSRLMSNISASSTCLPERTKTRQLYTQTRLHATYTTTANTQK